MAGILRLWRLGSFPALNADEAALGYNAYSLIKTGKDEHGNPWPLHFQSFNDYKPAGYGYIVLPFVYFAGLNEWSVRLPSALIGIANILVIYLLVLELVEKKARTILLDSQKSRQLVALASAFFLAISPWHIHFSRGGWEVNVATFCISLGVYFYLKYIRKKILQLLFFSVFSFVFSFYFYHAARVVSPLILFFLFILGFYYHKNYKKYLKKLTIAGVLGGFLVLPLIVNLFSGAVLSRASGVGIFSDKGPINRVNEQRGHHTEITGVSAKLFHNKMINYSLAFAENWGEHFWGEFLFLSGDDIQRNKVPETGQLYLLQALFIFAGLVGISREKDKKKWQFLVAWIIIAPVPAALTFQSPHALRSHNMVIPLTILSSYGAVWLVNKASKLLGSWKIVFAIFLFLITWEFIRYEKMYWKFMSKEYPYSSQYGVKELVAYLATRTNQYKNIVVTDRYDQPYILFLFYLKYPPEKFQNEHNLTQRDEYGFSTVRSFANFRFEPIEYNIVLSKFPNGLIAGTGEEIPETANIKEKIYGTNDYNYFEIVENK